MTVSRNYWSDCGPLFTIEPGSDVHHEVERPLTLIALRRAGRSLALEGKRSNFENPYRVAVTLAEYTAFLNGPAVGIVDRIEYGPAAQTVARKGEIARVEGWAIDIVEQPDAEG